MLLNHKVTGQSAAGLPPVLLAHGLFGSGRNLGVLARHLSDRRRVISVDMRNHGDSFRDPRHDYPALADDLARVIVEHGGKADLVGHSMGGKAAMAVALSRPELVRRLVVLDIAPVAYDHSQQGLIDAMRGLDLTGLTLRTEADARLAESVDDPGVRAFLLQSLDLKADPPRWKINLDALSEQMDSLTGWPSDLPSAGFDGPVLFLAGELSDYVDDRGRKAALALFPQARIDSIPGTGHWLHAERPGPVASAVGDFLDAG